MSTALRAAVVQHARKGGPRRSGEWLRAAGIELDIIHAYSGARIPAPGRYDAVVVLGAAFHCRDDARAPWLPSTRALIADALDRGIPLLGICLGAQLLADVAGGVVTRGVAPEHGSLPLSIRPDAWDDALFHDLPRTVRAIQHHKDAITELPAGAVWLASTERCPHQGFRVGESAWGVQFHPEVGPDRLLEWNARELRRGGLDRELLFRQAQADDGAAEPVWRMVTQRFAATVRASAAQLAHHGGP